MQTVRVHHPLGEVTMKTRGWLDVDTVTRLILDSLDGYQAAEPGRPAMRRPRRRVHRGESVRRYREHLALSQSELARRAGIRQNHLSEMEHGLRPIGRRNAERLARALGLDYRMLL